MPEAVIVVEISVKSHRSLRKPPLFPFAFAHLLIPYLRVVYVYIPQSKHSLQTASTFGLVSLPKEEHDRKWAAEKQIIGSAANGLTLGPRTVIYTIMLV